MPDRRISQIESSFLCSVAGCRETRALSPLGAALEHDPEKCVAVFGKDHAKIKELEHDDDSKTNHRALSQG